MRVTARPFGMKPKRRARCVRTITRARALARSGFLRRREAFRPPQAVLDPESTSAKGSPRNPTHAGARGSARDGPRDSAEPRLAHLAHPTQGNQAPQPMAARRWRNSETRWPETSGCPHSSFLTDRADRARQARSHHDAPAQRAPPPIRAHARRESRGRHTTRHRRTTAPLRITAPANGSGGLGSGTSRVGLIIRGSAAYPSRNFIPARYLLSSSELGSDSRL